MKNSSFSGLQGGRDSVSELPVGGFLKQSFNDYPGRVSAVIFTRGCNFRCVYCHNPELVLPNKLARSKPLSREEIFSWLSMNKVLLDAVVITGGEPTLHAGLPECIRQIKALGLEVKLDTNGTNPEMLEQLIRDSLVDYVAIDVKTVLDYRKYFSLCGGSVTQETVKAVRRSLCLLHESGMDSEARTTLLGSHHTWEDVTELIRLIELRFFLQECNTSKTLQVIAEKGFSRKEIAELLETIEPKRKNVCLR
ncbi:MAG: anaerobic ribonucleoside-triphosphate reductase activating protein [Chlorobiales bacterium]|nr:anaerobic ribonucleoside-triphosphate reductase activating protein [Chlorobiales bacterium]